MKDKCEFQNLFYFLEILSLDIFLILLKILYFV